MTEAIKRFLRVFKTRNERFVWTISTDDGSVIAQSGTDFPKREDCASAARSILSSRTIIDETVSDFEPR